MNFEHEVSCRGIDVHAKIIERTRHSRRVSFEFCIKPSLVSEDEKVRL